MMLWAVLYAYIGLLCALVVLTFLRKGEPMRRTALILLADMALGYFYGVEFGGAWDYSVYMILVNALACLLITWNPAGKWQALIGWSFIVQIGTDTGRVASEIYFGSSDIWAVYWMTTILAYLQLALLGAWWIDERTGYLSRFGHYLPVDEARRSGLA